MFEKVAYEHWSGGKIYNWLKFELNFKSVKSNKGLTLSNIYMILQNPFYYGSFEYPVGSGNWYQGKHEPLITKELFDEVQKQMKSQFTKSESKEFAFTKLMTCGLCGSGITAQEKFKKQQNGNVHRYVYYGCTKAKDKSCKCGLIEEKELIKQFEDLVDKLEFNEGGIKEKMKAYVNKVRDFMNFIFKEKTILDLESIDTPNYVRYILKKGEDIEKRELLGCLKSKIILDNKKIGLENINILT